MDRFDHPNGRFPRICGHTFDASRVGRGDWVIDVGANQGAFSRAMLDRGCSVLSIEPNPTLFDRLPSKAIKLHAAVGGGDGLCRFLIESDSTTSRVSGEGIEVPMVGPSPILARCPRGQIALMKVDIEGYEIAFLDAMTDEEFRRIDQFAIEFHSSHGLISKDDVARVLARFRSLGYYALDLTTCYMDVWVTAHPPNHIVLAYLRGLRLQRGFARWARSRWRF